SYVVFGGPGTGSTGVIEVSSLNGANGFVLNGVDPNDWSGWSVSGAGDVNGDGVDDLIIGAPGPAGGFYAGESYVVFGVLAIPPCAGDTDGDSDVDFSDLNILLDNWGTTGPEGDVDGDGDVDFIDLDILLDNWGNGC
ncbi:MAG: FG-GAP repeat protein, partial [Phycisphaerales bacterium]|nr:FG-GAP repeat protein [Phycisphaerales bacterium]